MVEMIGAHDPFFAVRFLLDRVNINTPSILSTFLMKGFTYCQRIRLLNRFVESSLWSLNGYNHRPTD